MACFAVVATRNMWPVMAMVHALVLVPAGNELAEQLLRWRWSGIMNGLMVVGRRLKRCRRHCYCVAE